MADAPKVEVKVESFDYMPMLKFLFWVLLVLIIFSFAYILILQNEEGTLNFIEFLNGLQILLGFYMLFLFYKLYTYVMRHRYYGDKLGEWYVKKYKPDTKSGVMENPNRSRFEKAKMHIGSQYKEEWKIGVIELDNILRDLLKQNGYKGETVGELLKDAGGKGLRSVDLAWEAHTVRNRVVHEGTNYDFGKEEAEKSLRKYSETFTELGI